MTNDELAKGRAELARLERLGGDPMRRRDGRGQLDLDGALPDLTAALDALADVDRALDEVTKCQGPTPGQRIRDAFEHIHLVTDAVIFDHEKAERSTRAQCVYWMGAAAAVAKERDEAQADRERLDDERKSWRALALHVGQLLTPYDDGSPLEGWEELADAMNDTQGEVLAWAKKHLRPRAAGRGEK